jgi:hypothetical protein
LKRFGIHAVHKVLGGAQSQDRQLGITFPITLLGRADDVNLKTAKALVLTLSEQFLQHAD